MDVDRHIVALEAEGRLLAEAADRAGLAAAVPSCPPWQVRDLLRHQGYVHRWATAYVSVPIRAQAPELTEAEQLAGGAADDRLLDWFRDGHGALIRTLRAADPGVASWTFLDAPSPLAFWARRQAHETAIHRADAQLAAGQAPGYQPDFAADGVDELIMGFGQRRKYRPGTSADGGVQVLATDTGDAWYLDVDQGRIQAHRGPGPGGCTVSGPASGVYLFLWNRSGDAQANVTIAGDRGCLTAWQSSVRVRWG